MANTDAILETATRLGEMIAEHSTVRRYTEVIEKLRKDTDAQRMLNDYHRHAQSIAEKEAANKPIEVDDKRKLERLQRELATHALLRDLQLRQMDYMDLMRRVDETIEAASGAAAQPGIAPPPDAA